ncbi:hypothetical protein [Paludisphaera sp.]|uniref:hypothetical protein n=1 Tax=Paludisphaera sp. TaxID=2017432 RepID=UPI00301BB2B5
MPRSSEPEPRWRPGRARGARSGGRPLAAAGASPVSAATPAVRVGTPWWASSSRASSRRSSGSYLTWTAFGAYHQGRSGPHSPVGLRWRRARSMTIWLCARLAATSRT